MYVMFKLHRWCLFMPRGKYDWFLLTFSLRKNKNICYEFVRNDIKCKTQFSSSCKNSCLKCIFVYINNYSIDITLSFYVFFYNYNCNFGYLELLDISYPRHSRFSMILDNMIFSRHAPFII